MNQSQGMMSGNLSENLGKHSQMNDVAYIDPSQTPDLVRKIVTAVEAILSVTTLVMNICAIILVRKKSSSLLIITVKNRIAVNFVILISYLVFQLVPFYQGFWNYNYDGCLLFNVEFPYMCNMLSWTMFVVILRGVYENLRRKCNWIILMGFLFVMFWGFPVFFTIPTAYILNDEAIIFYVYKQHDHCLFLPLISDIFSISMTLISLIIPFFLLLSLRNLIETQLMEKEDAFCTYNQQTALKELSANRNSHRKESLKSLSGIGSVSSQRGRSLATDKIIYTNEQKENDTVSELQPFTNGIHCMARGHHLPEVQDGSSSTKEKSTCNDLVAENYILLRAEGKKQCHETNLETSIIYNKTAQDSKKNCDNCDNEETLSPTNQGSYSNDKHGFKQSMIGPQIINCTPSPDAYYKDCSVENNALRIKCHNYPELKDSNAYSDVHNPFKLSDKEIMLESTVSSQSLLDINDETSNEIHVLNPLKTNQVRENKTEQCHGEIPQTTEDDLHGTTSSRRTTSLDNETSRGVQCCLEHTECLENARKHYRNKQQRCHSMPSDYSDIVVVVDENGDIRTQRDMTKIEHQKGVRFDNAVNVFDKDNEPSYVKEEVDDAIVNFALIQFRLHDTGLVDLSFEGKDSDHEEDEIPFSTPLINKVDTSQSSTKKDQNAAKCYVFVSAMHFLLWLPLLILSLIAGRCKSCHVTELHWHLTLMLTYVDLSINPFLVAMSLSWEELRNKWYCPVQNIS